MTAPGTQPADLLAHVEVLRSVAHFIKGLRVFVTSREKIRHPEGVDLFDEHVRDLDAAIESLAAHRGEVAVIGYVRRAPFYTRDVWQGCTKAEHDFINANGYWTNPKDGFNWPSITRPVYDAHPPQAQAGAGDAIPKASPLPTQADLFSAMHSTLGDAANAVKVLSTMLKKEGLREGLAVADEILGNIKHVLAALEARHEPE